MRSQDDVKPAFGQVWRYNMSSPIMLIRRGPSRVLGQWIAVWLRDYEPLSNLEIPWCGLYDEPKERIPDWELIDEGVE